MRILFAIPHYFAPAAAAHYGSERGEREARLRVTQTCLASLRQTFSSGQGLIDGLQRRVHPANRMLSASLTIALCTTGDRHLVADLDGAGFDHVRTEAEPRWLGFECHKVLKSGLGQYDYFAYLEDDLLLADPLFFVKLAWFAERFGEESILQPNRFEIAAGPVPFKLYIDGNMHAAAALPPARADGPPRLVAPLLGREFAFQRVANPHAGCFFLRASQLARWAAEPDFGMPSADFGGPLESAATLGLMRHFRVYKPSREDAGFLEVEHLDRRYLGRVFTPVPGDPPRLRWV